MYLFLSGIAPPIADIVTDGAGKQNRFLAHQPNVPAEPRRIQLPDVPTTCRSTKKSTFL